MGSSIFTMKAANWSFMTRFSKAALISQDSASVIGAIGVLRKSLLLVLEKSHNLVLSWAIVTSKQSNTQANKKQAKEANGKRARIKRQRWSGGEENERQMANNVMRGIRVCDGYLVCLDLCVDSDNGARNGSLLGVKSWLELAQISSTTAPEILLATSWALHWFSLEEERVMQ